ncbi:hypothetical protein C8Q79DRAFT_187275 [Trametes meyenii]|nr:hypothetical protein C8Q79DRAFT_187275 [Trametes meyenii]
MRGHLSGPFCSCGSCAGPKRIMSVVPSKTRYLSIRDVSSDSLNATRLLVDSLISCTVQFPASYRLRSHLSEIQLHMDAHPRTRMSSYWAVTGSESGVRSQTTFRSLSPPSGSNYTITTPSTIHTSKRLGNPYPEPGITNEGPGLSTVAVRSDCSPVTLNNVTPSIICVLPTAIHSGRLPVATAPTLSTSSILHTPGNATEDPQVASTPLPAGVGFEDFSSANTMGSSAGGFRYTSIREPTGSHATSTYLSSNAMHPSNPPPSDRNGTPLVTQRGGNTVATAAEPHASSLLPESRLSGAQPNALPTTTQSERELGPSRSTQVLVSICVSIGLAVAILTGVLVVWRRLRRTSQEDTLWAQVGKEEKNVEGDLESTVGTDGNAGQFSPDDTIYAREVELGSRQILTPRSAVRIEQNGSTTM